MDTYRYYVGGEVDPGGGKGKGDMMHAQVWRIADRKEGGCFCPC